MRVLHVISSINPHIGGPAGALQGLVESQRAAGLPVAIAATFRKGETDTPAVFYRQLGVPVSLLGPGITPLAWHPRIKPTLRALVSDADIVHIHALWEEIQHQGARIAQQLRKPYILRPCGMLDHWAMAKGLLRKKLYLWWRMRRNLDRAAALHFTSRSERDQAMTQRFHAEAIIEPNGVMLSEFGTLPAKGSFRSRYPQLGNRRVVLFLGRLHHKKGLQLLIPAFAEVGDPTAMLVLVGPDSGGYEATVRSLVDQYHLNERVLFTGMLYDKERVAAFVDADVFVLSSYQENFGNSVVEAMAAGTPVIVSDQVGSHEAVTAAGAGAVVPLDVGILARELTRWLADADLRQAAGTRARDYALSRYDWSQIARRWSVHYEELIARARRVANPSPALAPGAKQTG